MIKRVRQWKQDINGKTQEDKSVIVLSLGRERSLVIRKKPFKISYHTFAGCA
jgi:hypothetical protein